MEHRLQFLECRFGEQKRISQHGMVEGLAGRRRRKESAADENVGIDDERQSRLLGEEFRQDFFREAALLSVGSQLIARFDQG